MTHHGKSMMQPVPGHQPGTHTQGPAEAEAAFRTGEDSDLREATDDGVGFLGLTQGRCWGV